MTDRSTVFLIGGQTIITIDDVIDIIEAECTKDFHRISAIMPFEEEYFKRPLLRLFRSRGIWLALLLLTSLLLHYHHEA